jgi:hypothetical protein
MLPDFLVPGAVILVSLTATFILITRDWRYCILALALQYVGVFILVEASWPVEMAVAKMVAGWMSGAILGIAMASAPTAWRFPDQSIKFGPMFRFLAAIIVVLTIYSLVQHSDTWLSMIISPLRWGSFLLVGFGILQLSFASHPLRVIIGLLTALSGFEIIYAAIETSTLVTGLLAGVNLGLALVGAYILVAPAMESNP